MFDFNLILLLLQQMCVYLVLAYLLSKTPLFIPITQVTVRLPHKVLCYFVFSFFCILGTYLGLHIQDSIANTRAIGAVLGGLLGGPVVGFLVGFTGGFHRYYLGGMTAFSCMISTIVAGLLAGIIHQYYLKKGRVDILFHPVTAGVVTFCVEILQFAIILVISKPFSEAYSLVKDISAPMLVTNTIGSAMFMRILLDRRAMVEKYTSAFSAKALKIAVSTEGILHNGFNQDSSMKVAQVIYDELDIGAVAITDREKLLAFTGVGDDHHIVGTPISSKHTHYAIEHNEVVYLDGNAHPYQCSISSNCKLGATLIIPILGENQHVIGTIKLYEAKNKLFSSINRTLGEGIASLLSSQILAGQYERHKQLLSQSEIKLLHAQVNPHFLFNALNTLQAVIRKDSQQACELVQSLSTFFRKNLKRTNQIVTLSDELEHVNAYLKIEKARFSDRLQVNIQIPEKLQLAYLPTFSLQPIVENAIKHGIANLFEVGIVTITARQEADQLILCVEDNAGLYEEKPNNQGLGMNIVDKRLRVRYGEPYGVHVNTVANESTKVTLNLPLEYTL